MSQFAQAREGLRLAVGYDPRSPFYRNRPGLREVVREEMRKGAGAGMRGLGRLPGMRSAKKDVARIGTAARFARTNPYAGAAYVVIHPVSAGRSLLRTVIVFLLLLWIVYIAVVRPTIDAYVPDWAQRGFSAAPKAYDDLREFDDRLPPGFRPYNAPWHGVVPGSFTAAGCVQSTAETGGIRKGGFVGVAHAFGTAIREGVEADFSMRNFEEGIVDTARGIGAGIGAFQSAVRDGTPAPTEPVQPASVAPAVVQSASPPIVMSTNLLTDVQVAALSRAVGWPEEEVESGRVGARVLAESGNNPKARDYVDGTHHGLLQLGSAERTAYLAPGASADDPRANLRAARRLWQERGWQPWAASDRRHAQYLEQARAAAALATPSAIDPPVACETAGVQLVGGPATNAAEAELSQNAIVARRALLAAFPGSTIGGWGTRPNPTEHDDRDHTGKKASRALDVMNEVSPEGMARGRQVNAWLLAHWDDLRIGYVIWDRRIWFSPTSSKPYRGASPHVDHNHVTLVEDG